MSELLQFIHRGDVRRTLLWLRLSHRIHRESALGESVRHRYGRACISAPKPTIPSMINTSSPITIQPCNAVMFSSFTCVCLSLTAGIALGLPSVPPLCRYRSKA
jgi:hypothetical protein